MSDAAQKSELLILTEEEIRLRIRCAEITALRNKEVNKAEHDQLVARNKLERHKLDLQKNELAARFGITSKNGRAVLEKFTAQLLRFNKIPSERECYELLVRAATDLQKNLTADVVVAEARITPPSSNEPPTQAGPPMGKESLSGILTLRKACEAVEFSEALKRNTVFVTSFQRDRDYYEANTDAALKQQEKTALDAATRLKAHVEHIRESNPHDSALGYLEQELKAFDTWYEKHFPKKD